MTAKERIMAIRLSEKQEHNPEYTKQLGIQVSMVEKAPKMEEGNT